METNEQFPMALPLGSVLSGQYVVEKVLGQGGFGITYRAKDHKTGGCVAVKEFFPDTMATRTNTTVVPYTGERGEDYAYGKECFIEEAKTLAQFIGNENIVRIYNYFEENGTAYFVMDYVEGISLEEYIKQQGGNLSFEETFRLLSPIMDALAIVHSRGIIHRDVTPDNILITNDGKVKLLDFGAARYSLGDKSQSLDVVLKHGFAPKEQYVRRGKQGPFTDIYALGATFYYALTGKRPPDSVERMDQDNLVAPSRLGIHIPEEAEKAILTALSIQPRDRFQSIETFKGTMMFSLSGNYKEQSGDIHTGQAVQQRFFYAPDPDSKSENTRQTTCGYSNFSSISQAAKKKESKNGFIWFIDNHIGNIREIISACFFLLTIVGIFLARDCIQRGEIDDWFWFIAFQSFSFGLIAFGGFKVTGRY